MSNLKVTHRSALALRASLLLLAFVAAAPRTWAQAGQAEIAGEVRDPSGAFVPGAKVTAVDVDTARRLAATTGKAGVFVLSSLRPGRYRLETEASGFRPHLREGLVLKTGERARVDVVLEAGGFAESATVTADVSLLTTERSDVGQVIANREVVQLPLNGRSFISLVALAPGVALPPGSILPRLGGGRPRVNEYIYDGISVLQPEPGTVPYFPTIDAIQEFRVVTNSPPGGVRPLQRRGRQPLHEVGQQRVSGRRLGVPAP